MNPTQILRRSLSFALASLSLVAVGCAAGDVSEEPGQQAESSDPLVLWCSTPSWNTYNAPYYSVSAAQCSKQNSMPMYAGRQFAPGTDAKGRFEATLKAHGCTSAIGNEFPVTGLRGQATYSITLCPDDCTTWQAVSDYATVAPVYARMTRKTPTDCLVNSGGNAPAGKIYVTWDPICPGACKLKVGDPYFPLAARASTRRRAAALDAC